jgi:galactonate dehydratase
VQPDCSNAGGISEMARIAALAEIHGAAFAPHNPNGPVQGMASLHLAAALPGFTLLEHRFDLEDAFAEFGDSAPRSDGRGRHALPARRGPLGWKAFGSMGRLPTGSGSRRQIAILA